MINILTYWNICLRAWIVRVQAGVKIGAKCQLKVNVDASFLAPPSPNVIVVRPTLAAMECKRRWVYTFGRSLVSRIVRRLSSCGSQEMNREQCQADCATNSGAE